MSRSIELATTLAYAKGGYSVTAQLGRPAQVANLMLDTGSSALAVLPRAYAPDSDDARQPTALAQLVSYGQGSWAGPVLRGRLAFGNGAHACAIDDAQFALIQSDADQFYDADGIFGLAYSGLDTAHDCTALLRERGIEPPLTWPWPFDTGDGAQLAAFRQSLLQQPARVLTPCFDALEEEGVLRNLFALQIGRALVHVAESGASLAQLAADPCNGGLLVLGGGAHCRHLYDGPLQGIRIVHDLYYNAELIAVVVGDAARIAAPPLQASDVARSASNAIFDTGSSFIVLQQSIYAAVLEAFAQHDARLPALVTQFGQALAAGEGLPNSAIDPADWPPLHFIVAGSAQREVRLTCASEHYWQRNAFHAGQSYFMLLSQLPGWPDQSVLGLPLLAGRYCVFDRRVAGNGVLQVAPARRPAA